MKFGKTLKQLRKEAGLTQKELGKNIGVSRTTVAGYETMGKEPSYDILIKIAETLNCSLDYLLRHTEDEKEKGQRIDPEVKVFYEKLSEREDLQFLLRETEELDSDSIKRIVKIIDIIKEEKQSGKN